MCMPMDDLTHGDSVNDHEKSLKHMYRLEWYYLNISQWLKALYVAFDVRWHEINYSKYTGVQTTNNGSNNWKGSKSKCMQ